MIKYIESNISASNFVDAIIALGYLPLIVESALPPQRGDTSDLLSPLIRSQLIEGRVLVFYFSAPWCGACKIMEHTIIKNPPIATKLSDAGFLKIDIEADPSTAAALGVSAVPTLIIVSDSGAELYRRVGLIESKALALVLDELIE